MSVENKSSTSYGLTSTGLELTKALHDMVESGELDMKQKTKAMEIFDDVFPQLLREELTKLPFTRSKVVVKGNVDTYNVFEDAWRIDSVDNTLSAHSSTNDSMRARLYFK